MARSIKVRKSNKVQSQNKKDKTKKVSKQRPRKKTSNQTKSSKTTKSKPPNNNQQKMKILHDLAVGSANKAYCPYSKFKVGAVIVGKNGKYYTGCNVQNVVNGHSLCAQGTGIVKMVQDGCRQISEVYVVTKLSGDDISGPCGLCRQHIKQFSLDDSNLNIHVGSFSKGYQITYTLAQLFPRSFGPISLTK